MNEAFNQEIIDLLIHKLISLGIQLIFPCLIVICLLIGCFKLRELAIKTQQPALNYISYGLLSYALSFVGPILMALLIYSIGGDAFENYIDLTLSVMSFLLALIGAIFIVKATFTFKKIN
jgi:hypothetical protein